MRKVPKMKEMERRVICVRAKCILLILVYTFILLLLILSPLSVLLAKSEDEKTSVLIMFKDKPDKSLVEEYDGSVKLQYKHHPAMSADLPKKAIESLRKNKDIEYIIEQPSPKLVYQTIPWGVNQINAIQVHNEGNRGEGVNVAILDTGIDVDHPDLTYTWGYDFYGLNDADPSDGHGHGTHVAGIVSENDNSIGEVGVAPNVNLYVLKVFDDSGNADDYTDIIEAFEWCIDTYNDGTPGNEIQIVSISWGSSLSEGDPGIHAWITDLYDRGVVLVGASGNDGLFALPVDTVIYPARYSEVIAVGATDESDILAWFSSCGPSIELVAPGVNIVSTYPDDTYYSMEGTSMACPHVSGTVALMLASPVDPAYDSDSDGVWDNSEIRSKLHDTADDLGNVGRDDCYGYGLVDAEESATGVPEPPPPPPDMNVTRTQEGFIRKTDFENDSEGQLPSDFIDIYEGADAEFRVKGEAAHTGAFGLQIYDNNFEDWVGASYTLDSSEIVMELDVKMVKEERDILYWGEYGDSTYGSTIGHTNAAKWQAETFTVGETAYKLSSVKIYGKRVGITRTAVLSIRNVDGEGKPTGADLTSSSQSTASWSPSVFEWHTFDFTPYTLSAETTYALVAYCPDGYTGNGYNWRQGNFKKGHTFWESSDWGATWGSQRWQKAFEIYGTSSTGSGGVFPMRNQEWADSVYLLIDSNDLQYYDGAPHKIADLEYDVWYSIRVHAISDTDLFSVWVDGDLKAENIPLWNNADSFMQMGLCETQERKSKTCWDDILVYGSQTITVSGLDDGQKFALYGSDLIGFSSPANGGTAYFNIGSAGNRPPYMKIDITDVDGTTIIWEMPETYEAYGNIYGGDEYSVTVNEEPNEQPTAFIDLISPNPANYTKMVTFTGHGEDSDGTITAYEWSSNLDGTLSTQQSFTATTLSPGSHVISFKVQDNRGDWSGETSGELTIRPICPVCGEEFVECPYCHAKFCPHCGWQEDPPEAQ